MDRKQFFESLKPNFLTSTEEEKPGLGSGSADNTQFKSAGSKPHLSKYRKNLENFSQGVPVLGYF